MYTAVEGNVQVTVYHLKKSDKTDVYKKKGTWTLQELKQVDGKDESKVRNSFTITH